MTRFIEGTTIAGKRTLVNLDTVQMIVDQGLEGITVIFDNDDDTVGSKANLSDDYDEFTGRIDAA